MSWSCAELQQRLLEVGLEDLQREPEARVHMAECESCYSLLEVVASNPERLGSLTIQPTEPAASPPQPATGLATRLRRAALRVRGLRPKELSGLLFRSRRWAVVAVSVGVFVMMWIGAVLYLHGRDTRVGVSSPNRFAKLLLTPDDKLRDLSAGRTGKDASRRMASRSAGPSSDVVRREQGHADRIDARFGNKAERPGTTYGGSLDTSFEEALGGVTGTRIGASAGARDLGVRGRGGGRGSYDDALGGKADRGVKIASGSPVVMGSLDKEIIRRIIRENIAQIRYCYERELARSPDLYGKVVAKFIIAATGRVSNSSLAQTTMNNAAMEGCIISKVRGWRFPKPKGGGIVIVNYPFVFKRGAGAAAADETVAVNEAGDETGDEAEGEAEEEAEEEAEGEAEEEAEGKAVVEVHMAEDAVAAPTPSAELFLAERARTEKLTFKQASGYWANSYVPGDPALRFLHAQLQGRDRGTLAAAVGAPVSLHDAAHQTSQPFDPPASAALTVYLQSDRAAVDGPTRMLVQVGLKGTRRHSGLRSAMNVGVVLDLRSPLAPESAAAARALLESLARARQVGDRFSLFVAGQPGGQVVGPDSFRYGAVKVAMQRLLSSEQQQTEPPLDLTSATAAAFRFVNGADDPTAPIGSSVVLLVSTAPMGRNLDAMTRLAQSNALRGGQLSVVGLGSVTWIDEIDRLTLAGQGNRRLLSRAAEAEELVERELSAASRVVARAVRLRVRLAPGVKLVDVISSRNLDRQQAQAVRLAEQSIDRRVASKLGIVADRGEDEAGIQIVIPSFYAGDAHAVLLDVVVARPGPIADVTARYKDLVYLRNGVGRASLSLGRGPAVAGALELNVLKNYLALQLSSTLSQAGLSLARGDEAGARDLLRRHVELLDGLGAELPGLQKDWDLAGDRSMLAEYAALLDTRQANPQIYRQHLSDSLQLAGLFKILPRPSLGDLL